MLEVLTLCIKHLIELLIVAILEQIANLLKLVVEVRQLSLVFSAPGAGLADTNESLQEIVVVQVAGVKTARLGEGLLDLNLGEHLLLCLEDGLLLGGQRLARSQLVLGLLLLLLLIGALLLGHNQKSDLSHDCDELVLSHL